MLKDKLKEIKCTKCGKDRKVHTEIHHKNGVIEYICDLCREKMIKKGLV